MQHTQFMCLDPVFVNVSAAYAESLEQNTEFDYSVATGYHFGTMYREDLHPGPAESLDQLVDPCEVLRLWVLDCWLMNCDRLQYGNVLFELGSSKWSLVASDHSDCFYGADYLQSGGYLERATGLTSVGYSPLFEQAVLAHGAKAIRDSIQSIQDCAADIRSITGKVPAQWWDEANVDPEKLEKCLEDRAAQLREICDVNRWEGLGNAIQGGVQLQLLQ